MNLHAVYTTALAVSVLAELSAGYLTWVPYLDAGQEAAYTCDDLRHALAAAGRIASGFLDSTYSTFRITARDIATGQITGMAQWSRAWGPGGFDWQRVSGWVACESHGCTHLDDVP